MSAYHFALNDPIVDLTQELWVWAGARYDQGYGYQVLRECYGRSEVEKLYNDVGRDKAEFFAACQQLAEIWSEQHAGAQGDF